MTSICNSNPRTLTIMSACATASNALAFVRERGVVPISAKGPAPRLAETITGEAIEGNSWAHPQSRHIYAILQAVVGSGQVLVCLLVDGKITLVHRRLWPAPARLADRFAPGGQTRSPETIVLNRTANIPPWQPTTSPPNPRAST